MIPRWAIVAYLWDRREQYRESSGTYHAITELIEAVAGGEHVEAFRHGELDDLRGVVEPLLGSETG